MPKRLLKIYSFLPFLFVVLSFFILTSLLFTLDRTPQQAHALTPEEQAQYAQQNNCTWRLGTAGYLCYANTSSGSCAAGTVTCPNGVGCCTDTSNPCPDPNFPILNPVTQQCEAVPIVVHATATPTQTPTNSGSIGDGNNLLDNGKRCSADSQCKSKLCKRTSENDTRKYCVAQPTATPTAEPLTCDPVENGKIDEADFELWKKEYTKEVNTTKTACLSPNNKVDLLGFQVWKDIFIHKVKQAF